MSESKKNQKEGFYNVDKYCSYFSTGEDNIIRGDVLAKIRSVSKDSFIIESRANLNIDINKSIITGFIDNRGNIVSLAGYAVEKKKNDEGYQYKCDFNGPSYPAMNYIYKNFLSRRRKGKSKCRT